MKKPVDDRCRTWAPVSETREEAVARRTDPQTSHTAADSVQALRDSQQRVLKVLQDDGDGTDEDIASWYASSERLLGWPQQSPSGLRTRRSELVDAGFVFDTGRRKTLPSGRESIVWTARRQSMIPETGEST